MNINAVLKSSVTPPSRVSVDDEHRQTDRQRTLNERCRNIKTTYLSQPHHVMKKPIQEQDSRAWDVGPMITNQLKIKITVEYLLL